MTFIKPYLMGKFDTTYNPAGLWLFEDNLNDSSGNGLNLTGAVTGYTTQDNNFQKGVIFGTTSLIRSINDPELRFTNALTIEVVCMLPLHTSAQILVYYGGGTAETEATNYAYQFSVHPDRRLRLFWEYGAGVNAEVSSTIKTPYDCPVYLAVTRDANNPANITFYINAIKENAGSAPRSTGATTANFQISTNTVLMREKTIIYGVKVIGRELTEQEIYSEYNKTLGGRNVNWPVKQ